MIVRVIAIASIVLLSFSCFAQEETKVEENNEKIEELNERLDNLLGGTKSITSDSIEYKLDLLFQEIRSIKTEIQTIQSKIENIEENAQKSVNENGQVAELNRKVNDALEGKYFVVIGSEREQSRADQFLAKQIDTEALSVVKNSKGTWFHIIYREPYTMKEAISKTVKERQAAYNDAWWVTERKLQIN